VEVCLVTKEVNQAADVAGRLSELHRSALSSMASRNRFGCSGLVHMKTFETIDPKVARRCRYDQHRSQMTSLTVEGSLVTGLVHSVMEVKSSNPTRWIITVIAKPSIAA
jgi:hypothetical protein